MLFLGKNTSKDSSRRRRINSSGGYDIINTILGILVVISTIFIFIDREKYEKFFVAVFLFAAAMNICMGLKYFKRNEILKMVALMLAGIFLIGMTVITFLAFW